MMPLKFSILSSTYMFPSFCHYAFLKFNIVVEVYFSFLFPTQVFPSSSNTHFVDNVCCELVFCNDTFKIVWKILIQFFLVVLSHFSQILLLHLWVQNPLVSFGSNKSKVHVVVDVNFNAIVAGVVISTNVAIFWIYHVDFIRWEKKIRYEKEMKG